MTPVLARRRDLDGAFERVYRRHAADVYRYALAVLRAPADAEDVTQTTFLNAYRAFQRGERPRQAKNWLIAIAHNVCRQRFRDATRRPSEVELHEEVAAAIPEDEASPTVDDIRRALAVLPFNQRSALVMRELEGRSYADIAEVLGVSVSAVETVIFRARRALREQLEGSLTCADSELALSKQLDGRLGRAERGQLRAHLRECPDCARLARRLRAQRSAWRGLAAIPLPSSLGSFIGGGGAITTAVAAKAVAVTALGVLLGGGAYELARQSDDTAKARRLPPVSPAAAARDGKDERPITIAYVRASAPDPPPVVRRLARPSLAPSPQGATHAVRATHVRGPRTRTAAKAPAPSPLPAPRRTVTPPPPAPPRAAPPEPKPKPEEHAERKAKAPVEPKTKTKKKEEKEREKRHHHAEKPKPRPRPPVQAPPQNPPVDAPRAHPKTHGHPETPPGHEKRDR